VSWLRRLRYRKQARGTPLEPFYAAPLPARGTPWQQLELLALDFETSGLDHRHDRILSMGWVRIRQARIELGSARQVLIQAEGSVGQSATVHGLTDSDLRQGLSLQAAVRLLLRELHGRVLVAHGAAIELGFLSSACRACFGLPPSLRSIDTLALEQRLRRHQNDRQGELRLHACRERHNLPSYRPHSAAVDALACAELLLAQAGRIGDETRLRLRDLL
jgi:DNA polymerase-3 subunit epsilon